MRRLLLVATLAVSLLFQGVAFAGQRFVAHAGEGMAHAMLHWDKAAHHHHDDGSFHEEESDQCYRHLQADHLFTLVVIVSDTSVALPVAAAFQPRHTPLSALLPPVLDGPRRPPRIAG